MKRFLTLALLLVFMFSIIGWQWMFLLKLNSHESRQLNNRPDADALEVIVLSNADAGSDGKTFFVNNHEIIHNGKLFDIKFKTKRGDDIVLYCEADGAEENLNASFDLKTQDVFGNTLTSKSSSQKIVKLSVFEQVNEISSLTPSLSINDLKTFSSPPHCLSALVNSFFVPPDIA